MFNIELSTYFTHLLKLIKVWDFSDLIKILSLYTIFNYLILIHNYLNLFILV